MLSRWLIRASLRSPALPLVFALTVVLGALAAGCQQGGVGATCEIREDCQSGLVCCTDCGRRGFCQTSCDGTFCPDAHVETEDAGSDDAFAPETPDAAAAPDAAEAPDAFVSPDAFTPPDAADDVDGGT